MHACICEGPFICFPSVDMIGHVITSTNSFVCYGDLVADLVMQIPRLPIVADQSQLARSLTVEPGGAGNTLITAARLGAQAIALGAVGEDAQGNAIHAILQAEGVIMGHAQRGAGSVNVIVLVFVDEAGQHVFIAHDGTGAPFEVGAREREVIQQAGAFFIPGYSLDEGRMAAAVLPAMQIALEANVPVMNDLGPIVREADLRETALHVVGHSLVTLLTEDEAMTFTEQLTPLEAAHALLEIGSRYVILKRGGRGCAVYDNEGIVEIEGIPVTVRDTTAAGDSFAGGFIVDWLQHGDIVRAARFANIVGAAKVQKIGSGRQCPTREEVSRLLKELRIEN